MVPKPFPLYAPEFTSIPFAQLVNNAATYFNLKAPILRGTHEHGCQNAPPLLAMQHAHDATL